MATIFGVTVPEKAERERVLNSGAPLTSAVLLAVHAKNLPEDEHTRACALALQRHAWDLEHDRAVLRNALTVLEHGATTQGAHVGMSWAQAAEIIRTALAATERK